MSPGHCHTSSIKNHVMASDCHEIDGHISDFVSWPNSAYDDDPGKWHTSR